MVLIAAMGVLGCRLAQVRTSWNCTMKFLVYLTTSSEVRRLDVDSEGAWVGWLVVIESAYFHKSCRCCVKSRPDGGGA